MVCWQQRHGSISDKGCSPSVEEAQGPNRVFSLCAYQSTMPEGMAWGGTSDYTKVMMNVGRGNIN